MKMPYETTVDYTCGACKARGVKLWRGVHGCKMEGHDLLCAACVAPPGTFVDDDGKGVNEHAKAFDDPDCFLKRPTVCVGRGLPAIPVDDTYYGHTSVPEAGLAWWRALPTYGADGQSINTFDYQILYFWLDLTIDKKVPVGLLYAGNAGKPGLRTFLDHVPPSHREMVAAALSSADMTALPESLDSTFFDWSEPTRAWLHETTRAEYADKLHAFFVGKAPKFCACGGQQ